MSSFVFSNQIKRGTTSLAAILAVVVVGFAAVKGMPRAHADARAVPAPALDEPASNAASEIAVVAGGCFWGVQGVFQHVKGVTSAVSGYTGGAKEAAEYETVSSGRTGHAESVQITFDPTQITYGQLLRIFFSVAHDPTQLNFQGPDEGTQYRSAIFPASDAQANVAAAYIAQLDQAHVFSRKIVTTIEKGKTFYAAESYHQDYLTLNPSSPYIAINDLPKIADLQKVFPDRYRAAPVLVNAR